MARLSKNVDARIAHLPGVKAHVRSVGEQIAARARTNLAAHQAEGQARIETRREDTDFLVELVDTAALSIETGRGEFEQRLPEGGSRTIGAADALNILRGAL